MALTTFKLEGEVTSLSASSQEEVEDNREKQASTLTFCLTCPFGKLKKKSTCPTQSFSCPKKINKNFKKQRIIISSLCKMFWLLSHKHYRILSLIPTYIMIMTSLIDKLTYT